MIHQPLSPDGFHPQISSSLRSLFLCLVRPDLFVKKTVCLFLQRTHFFQWLPDKCHTSVFNALIETLRVCYSLNDSKVAFCKTGFTFV